MRKLLVLAMLFALVVALLTLVVPPLCANGNRDGGTCDVVTLLRGGIRLINSDQCQSGPTPPTALCQATQAAGLQ
jgi:hypothetical protein